MWVAICFWGSFLLELGGFLRLTETLKGFRGEFGRWLCGGRCAWFIGELANLMRIKELGVAF